MEELFRSIAANVALLLEAMVVLLVLIGAIETLYLMGRYLLASDVRQGMRRGMWMRFARWLVVALEFALGADIIRTAIAPTWTEIGQLAAIAAIRTGLGLFLERDISAFGRDETPA